MTITDKKPEVFEKTTSNIWTDPYIRKQMLKEHLNTLSDGASRKPDSVNRITDFILSHTKPAGRLLDLGCGPGLYTSRFSDNGYQVTGIDFNEASIEYAAEKRKDIHYITGDYIKEYPAGQYDAVIMIYCDLGTHSDKDRDVLLGHIYHSLDEGGVFIFDVFTKNIVKDKREGRNWEHAPTGGFWSENEYLLLSQTFHYPEHHAFAYQYNLLEGKDNKHFIIWDRYYSEEEITGVLKNTGFKNVRVYRDVVQDNNFTSSSEMFIVAEK